MSKNHRLQRRKWQGAYIKCNSQVESLNIYIYCNKPQKYSKTIMRLKYLQIIKEDLGLQVDECVNLHI